MINIGNNSIDNILVGTTQVEKVYLGTDIVWEHSQPSIKKHLTFTALESGTFNFQINVNTNLYFYIEYSLDNGQTWTRTNNVDNQAVDVTTPTVLAGAKVLWRGSGNRTCVTSSTYTASVFTSTCRFNASGNIMSLLYPSDYESRTTAPEACFRGLFKGCTTIVTPPDLPATTLNQNCYYLMFMDCTSLTMTPDLPSMNVPYQSYCQMFSGCTSLTTAMSELPATTIGGSAYYYMFSQCAITTTPVIRATSAPKNALYGMFDRCGQLATVKPLSLVTVGETSCRAMFYLCVSITSLPADMFATLTTFTAASGMYEMFAYCSSLTAAPEIPATALYSSCYRGMFYGCTSLTTPPSILPATTLKNDCYRSMFGSTGLIKSPELPALTLADRSYAYMFENCSSLSHIKMMATSVTATNCLQNWVNGVAAQGTFVKNPATSSLPTGSSGIPTNWTVVDADD